MPELRRTSSQKKLSQISLPDAPCVSPVLEISRLQLELAELDRDMARLQRQVAETGNPIKRIALIATCAARRATSSALDCWTEILAGRDPAAIA